MHTLSHHAIRIFSAAIYPILSVVNLWILHLSFTAAGIPLSPLPWWITWSVFYLALIAAKKFSHTRIGQWLGALRVYAFSAHLLLSYASAAAVILLILFPRLLESGTHTAGILSLIIFSAALFTAIYGFGHAKKLHLNAYSLKTDKCVPNGTLSIVHLSDIHLGYIQNEHFVHALVRRVNVLTPDLICITGDTFCNTMQNIRNPSAIAAQIAHLRTKYGVYACLGNHDVGDCEKMASFFDRAKIRVLEDESLFPARNVALIGRADATPGGIRMRRATVGECMVGTDPLQYRILLDHQPREISAVAERGADLMLSGHTHGGQFYPAAFAIRRRFRCHAGQYRYGKLHVIVSTGSGAGSPPLRLGTQGEIVLITVRQISDNS